MVRLRAAADHHKQAAALAKHPAGAERASAFVAWTSRLGLAGRAPGAPHPPPATSASNQAALRRALSVTADAVRPGEGSARPVAAHAVADSRPNPGPGGPPTLLPRWSTGRVAGARAEGAGVMHSQSERAAGSVRGDSRGSLHHAGAHAARRGQSGSGEAGGGEEVVVTLGELARRRDAGAAQPPLPWQPAPSGGASPGARPDSSATGAGHGPALGGAQRAPTQGFGSSEPGPHLGPAAAGPGASGGSRPALNGMQWQPGQMHRANQPAGESVALLMDPPNPHESASALDGNTNREAAAGSMKAGQGISKGLDRHSARSPLARRLAAFISEDPERFILLRRSNLAVVAGLAALTALWVALMVIDAQPDQAARCGVISKGCAVMCLSDPGTEYYGMAFYYLLCPRIAVP